MSPSFEPLTVTPVSFSLTDGTNIPAPPPEEAAPPPHQSTTASDEIPLTPGEGPSQHSNGTHHANGLQPGVLSPAHSPITERKRPSSVRKLLSLRSIRSEKDRHSQYGTPSSPLSTDGKLSTDSHSVLSRPGSPYTISTIMSSDSGKHSLGRKRSSAWFGGRRKSGFFPLNVGKLEEEGVLTEGGAVKPVRRGPPPPAIPEFREFRSLGEALDDGGSLGAEDMFKDIK